MSAHDLHDKRTLMRVRRTDDGIDGLDDPVQGRIRSDGHVRTAEIVINRTDHAGNVQRLVLESLLLGDLALLQQLVQQAGPLLPEQVRTGQRTVTTDHDQVGDATADQVEGGLQTTLTLPEIGTTSGTDHGTAPVDNTGHRGPTGLDDVLAAVHHALVALSDEVDLWGFESKLTFI